MKTGKLTTCFLLLFALAMPACGIWTNAKTAAKEWWDENGKKVLDDAAGAAKDYWTSHKDDLIAGATEAAVKLTKKQMEDQRVAVLAKLTNAGYKTEDMDTDHNGVVDEAELALFLKSNPTALYYGGLGSIGLLGMWYLKQLLDKNKAQGGAVPVQPVAA